MFRLIVSHHQAKELNDLPKHLLLSSLQDSVQLYTTVEPLLSGLVTGCHWPDNKKSRIIVDDPKTTC
jgi:hypothetical protein